jgi:hypothetical protein
VFRCHPPTPFSPDLVPASAHLATRAGVGENGDGNYRLYLANPGWYLINFVAVRTKAKLRRYDAPSRTYVDVIQWDNTAGSSFYEPYAFLAKLEAGYHYFYWMPTVPENVYVIEVSVTKL